MIGMLVLSGLHNNIKVINDSYEIRDRLQILLLILSELRQVN